MDQFPLALGALLDAVGELTDHDFERPSGCAGRLVRHFVIDAQDVLLVGTGRRAPTESERAEPGELKIPFVLGQSVSSSSLAFSASRASSALNSL